MDRKHTLPELIKRKMNEKESQPVAFLHRLAIKTDFSHGSKRTLSKQIHTSYSTTFQ